MVRVAVWVMQVRGNKEIMHGTKSRERGIMILEIAFAFLNVILRVFRVRNTKFPVQPCM